MSNEVTSPQSREITPDVIAESNKRLMTDTDLSAIASFADAMSTVENTFGGVDDFANYGSGFEVLDDKDKLLKTPFVILEFTFSQGEMGEFVSAPLVTEDGRKYILNDGSTGICKQLRDVRDRRLANGIFPAQQGVAVRKGLRVSSYKYTDPTTGKETPAKTYYLA